MPNESGFTSDGNVLPVAQPVVCVVEDDDSARGTIVAMLNDRGHRCREFPSAEAFLAAGEVGHPGCLVLDYKLPGISGLELLERLRGSANQLPVVVTTGHADVTAAVRFMERGAVAVLEKPFRAEDLSAAITRAMRLDEVEIRVRARFEQINAAVDQLSPREKTVLKAIVAGQLNKAIARALDVSVRTIEGDRAKIVDKFGAETTGEVVGKFAQFTLLTELGYGGTDTRLRSAG